jgi:hypothetical protein
MRIGVIALVGCLAMPAPALAQRMNDNWVFQVGAYFPRINSELQVNGPLGDGTEIDFERDLGYDRSSTLVSAFAEWRPGDDWVFNVEYYALNRSNTQSIERDITVGDTTYPASATVSSGFDSDIFRFTIGNRLIQRETWEIGAAIGVHGTDFSTFIEGEGSVGGQSGQFQSETRSVFAPLPTIGLFLNATPAARVNVAARFDWLSLSIDDYSGRLINTQASVAYSIHKNFDVGVMYRYVDYRLKVDRDDWEGKVRYQFSGPAIFLQAGF